MLGRFIFLFIALRTTNQTQQTRARSWQQFESNLPKGWNVEPVSVGETENNTQVEDWFEVFKILVELSGIDKTWQEVLKELWVEIYQKDWEDVFYHEWEWFVEWKRLCFIFLKKYYDWRYAFIKMGDREIYGRVRLLAGIYKMPTARWILTMPALQVEPRNWNDVRCFFPMKALLNDNEWNLFNTFSVCYQGEDMRDWLEKQIIQLLTQLVMTWQPKSIIETNNVYERIEQLCKDSWVVKKVEIQNNKLTLGFDWRLATDNSEVYGALVLPPVELIIDLQRWNIRWNWQYHPHVLSDNSLCLGWELKNLVDKCLQQKDLYGLVSWIIQFANSWTSNDADNCEREPQRCIKRYVDEYNPPLEEVHISKEDLKGTMECKFSYGDLPYWFQQFLSFNQE